MTAISPKPGPTNDQLSTIFADFLAGNPLSKIKRQSFEKDGLLSPKVVEQLGYVMGIVRERA